jgi:hypothetical protein
MSDFGLSPRGLFVPRPDSHPGKTLHLPPSAAAPVDDGSEVTDSMSNLHDSEVLAIEQIWNDIAVKFSGGEHDIDAMAREIVDRFANIDLWVTDAHGARHHVQCGFSVSIKMFEDPVTNTWSPEIQIDSRINPEAFDHDRKVREVVRDILGLGQEGWIKDGQMDLR